MALALSAVVKAAGKSPSPLWGGVGEGCLFLFQDTRPF
jgi:hypothetical protein